ACQPDECAHGRPGSASSTGRQHQKNGPDPSNRYESDPPAEYTLHELAPSSAVSGNDTRAAGSWRPGGATLGKPAALAGSVPRDLRSSTALDSRSRWSGMQSQQS